MNGKSIKDLTTKVNPTLAQWLKRHYTNNRPEDKGEIARLAEDMKNGNYYPGTEVIAVDHNGNVINGWHTLCAIILSGCTVDVIVATELDPMTRFFFDVGKKRTHGHFLTMEGFNWKPYHIAATLNLLTALGRGDVESANNGTLLSPQKVVELRQQYPEVEDSAETGVKLNRWLSSKRLVSLHYRSGVRVFAAADFLFSHEDAGLWERFLADLMNTENSDTPPGRLRANLLTEQDWSRNRLAVHWGWFQGAWEEYKNLNRPQPFRFAA